MLAVSLVTFGITVIVLMAGIVIGMVAQSYAPAVPRAAHPTTLPNIAYALISAALHAAAAPLLTAVPLAAVVALGGGLFDLPDNGAPLIASAVIMLLSLDLAEYAFHRLQHAWRPLWILHALHHSDADMNVTTTNRHFWGDRIIKALFLYPLVDIVFKTGPNAMLIYMLATSYNFIPHTSVRWSFGRFWMVLNGPQYHRIHHSRDPAHYNRNFAALLPVFDLLFGTWHRPAEDEFPETGLDGVALPPGVLPMLAWPFGARRAAGSQATEAD